MRKVIYGLSLLVFVLISCNKTTKKDPFLVSPTQVGVLTKDAQVRELDSIFSKDSVVKENTGRSYNNGIMVYDKSGNELLKLDPVQRFDSTSTIANIQIRDKRYKTKKGLSNISTFKDITANYKISRIENTLRTAVIFIDEINAYVTIDKQKIAGDARFNTRTKIEPSQIDDDAPIKHFWIGWR